MSCAGHVTATVQAHKLLECYFHTRDRQVLRILGLVDTGNTVPGSAAISVDLAAKLGVKINPSPQRSQEGKSEKNHIRCNKFITTSTNLKKIRIF